MWLSCEKKCVSIKIHIKVIEAEERDFGDEMNNVDDDVVHYSFFIIILS